MKHINSERNAKSTSWKNPKCIAKNYQPKIFNDEEHIFDMFLDLHDFWNMDPAAFLSLSPTPDEDHITIEVPQT